MRECRSELLPRRAVPFRAVVFDMDGVIADSEPFYAEAMNEVLKGTGRVMTEGDHKAVMGSSLDYTWDWAMRRFQLSGSIEDWKREYDAAVVRLLGTRTEANPGLFDLLDELTRRQVPLGVASSSQQAWVKTVLSRLGIQHRFQAIVSREMADNAKPAPDLYLLAAQLLCVPPGDCIAIEDTPRGIQAAKAAGLFTVALRTGPTAGMDISSSDMAINALAEFPLELLSSIQGSPRGPRGGPLVVVGVAPTGG